MNMAWWGNGVGLVPWKFGKINFVCHYLRGDGMRGVDFVEIAAGCWDSAVVTISTLVVLFYFHYFEGWLGGWRYDL